MDIVLEIFDTVALDWVYATALPSTAESVPILKESLSYHDPKPNTTIFNAFHNAAAHRHQSASHYLQLQPTKWAYMSKFPRENIYRQAASLYLITWIFGLVIYFVCSSLSYRFIFDKSTAKHPKYLKNQVWMEIRQTLESLPVMSICTLPFFLAEVRGHAKLYDTTAEGPGWWYNWLQFPFFVCFTDFFIYWIHRGLHHPLVYKKLHKPHHKWIMPTPYASHAFHPLDGFAQSIPYHVFPFLFPLQKFAYVALFIFINIWTVFIHDGEYVANSPIINGAACHTMHHLYFNYNYGQFTTVWDRLGGSYRKPNDELFSRESKMGKIEWDRQVKEMESMVKVVEGTDDRSYGAYDGQLPQAEEKKLQ